MIWLVCRRGTMARTAHQPLSCSGEIVGDSSPGVSSLAASTRSAGQSFMADQLPKVREVREAVRRHGGDIWVQVDGGVSASTIEQCAEAGADVFVAGSAVYGAESAAAAVDELREMAERHSH